MILQCDQCNTKFRLDDSKLKPGGVKVRCSKCRHVFVAGAEQKQEESEFDALLSGLGAPASAPAPEAAPSPAAQQAGAELAALEFGAEEGEQPQAPPAREASDELEFGDISFETATPSESRAAEEGGASGEFEFNEEPSAPAEAAPAAEGFGFGEFSFDEVAAPKEEPAAPVPGSDLGFGEFSFEEGGAPGEQEEQAAPAPDLDFGEVSFDETPATASEAKPAPAPSGEFDFGEFSFDETPSAPQEEKGAPAPSGLDFGEFSFEEEPSAPKEEQQAPAPSSEFDFGDFSFEEPGVPGEEKKAPAPVAEPDFGGFTFEEEPAAAKEKKEASAPSGEFGIGEFSFEEEPAASKEGKGAPGPTTDIDFSEFTFEEEPPILTEGAAPAAAEPAVPPAQQEEEFTFGEAPEPAAPPTGAAAAGLAAAGLAAAGKAKPAEPVREVPPPAAAKPAGKSPLDFSFGEPGFATPVPEEGPEEEELPPLSIASRRKGRSILTIAIVTVSVLAVLALSAAGLYLLQSGPQALNKLDKLGIGFVAKWFGMETPEEGRITIRNPLASFHQNKEAGELFVVTGEAVNTFRKPRASVQVKVSIFDKSGKVLLQKTAYCGNRLSDEQLANLPMEKLESIMNNQFGDSLSNLGVKPGQGIGFVVALANVPKEAADFGVEVVGSTVASGQ